MPPSFPRSVGGVHFEALRKRGPHEEPLLTRKKMMGWATQQEEVLGSGLIQSHDDIAAVVEVG